ncbi:hypothetical protein [Comamonas sp. 17RB]|uniref:DUF6984 family protein n=1 Tax=Comamonas sp. 17RB TaxID=3047025 RepID=UPI0024B659A9|nr:hypothetical protein [Comamonas sp. 17RB]MDI9853894.1 hypothetical protein [Comamonas sp. 17RB]
MRHLFEYERPLVQHLFTQAGASLEISALIVRPMSGGMGSLSIAPFNISRKLGASPAECHFYDADGTPVSVVLNLDQDGKPFEIDIWRVDFQAVMSWPLERQILPGFPDR